MTPRHGMGPSGHHLFPQWFLGNGALQGITPVLEMEISPAATKRLLKHCENPALPGAFTNRLKEKSALDLPSTQSSWRPGPGSKQPPEIVFLKENTAVHSELLAGTGTWCVSETAQAGPPY